MDANGGIQKVRVEPATRSAVATCYTPGRGKIVPRNVMSLINVMYISSQLAGKDYKDSDYTLVIAVMQ